MFFILILNPCQAELKVWCHRSNVTYACPVPHFSNPRSRFDLHLLLLVVLYLTSSRPTLHTNFSIFEFTRNSNHLCCLSHNQKAALYPTDTTSRGEPSYPSLLNPCDPPYLTAQIPQTHSHPPQEDHSEATPSFITSKHILELRSSRFTRNPFHLLRRA